VHICGDFHTVRPFGCKDMTKCKRGCFFMKHRVDWFTFLVGVAASWVVLEKRPLNGCNVMWFQLFSVVVLT